RDGRKDVDVDAECIADSRASRLAERLETSPPREERISTSRRWQSGPKRHDVAGKDVADDRARIGQIASVFDVNADFAGHRDGHGDTLRRVRHAEPERRVGVERRLAVRGVAELERRGGRSGVALEDTSQQSPARDEALPKLRLMK